VVPPAPGVGVVSGAGVGVVSSVYGVMLVVVVVGVTVGSSYGVTVVP